MDGGVFPQDTVGNPEQAGSASPIPRRIQRLFAHTVLVCACVAAINLPAEHHECVDTRDDPERRVRNWQTTGPILEEIRLRELAQLNLADFVESMDGLVEASLRISPAQPSSGLVKLQEWFRKLPRDFRVFKKGDTAQLRALLLVRQPKSRATKLALGQACHPVALWSNLRWKQLVDRFAQPTDSFKSLDRFLSCVRG
jgi:hypothetical protein